MTQKYIAVSLICCIFDVIMKSLFELFIKGSLFLTALSALAEEEITLMTYNVRNGVGLDEQRDYQRIAEVINNVNPHFVAIQEVDSVTNRANQSYVLGEIADATGMNPVYAPAIKYDGGLYGIGLLSVNLPDSVKCTPLPGREEQRTLLVAYFKDYVIANTHLSLTPEDALESVGIINTILKTEFNRPVILMGDFNSYPDSPVIKELSRDYIVISPDAPSFPADDPDERIDYILINKDATFKIDKAEVIPATIASDHRPVSVTIIR